MKKPVSMGRLCLVVGCGLLAGAYASGQPREKEAGDNAGPPARGERPPRPTFESLDTDSDGLVTLAEYTAFEQDQLKKQFAKLDADQNGCLNEEELAKFGPPRRGRGPAPSEEGIRQEPPAEGDRPEPPEGGRRPRGEGRGRGHRPAPLTMETLDSDKNGAVSLQEFSAVMRKQIAGRFKLQDSNSDGALTDDEFNSPPPRGGRGPDGGRRRPPE